MIAATSRSSIYDHPGSTKAQANQRPGRNARQARQQNSGPPSVILTELIPTYIPTSPSRSGGWWPPGAPQPCQRTRASSPPTPPASPRAVARPAPSVAGPPPSATTTRWPATEPPTNSEGVKAVLRGIRRTIGAAKQGKAPATADLIGQMLALCPDSMIGKRDCVLLCLGFAGAFRRSEVCALEVADLTEVADGLRILIRRSKGDQEGQGQEMAIPRGYRLRRVEAVQAWLAAAEISSGPVFRAVAQGGKVSDVPLADDSAARIVKRYARRVGLDPATYAGHSLRSGFLTSAAESSASVWKLSEVSRQDVRAGELARSMGLRPSSVLTPHEDGRLW
jgi:hypothetical protein